MTALEFFRVLSALLSRLGAPAAIFSLAGRELACSLLYAIPVYLLFKLLHHWTGGERVRGVRL